MEILLGNVERAETTAPHTAGNIPQTMSKKTDKSNQLKTNDMKIKKGFEIQNVCGEYIIVPAGADNVDYSKIISLNETAAYLWENVAPKESFDIEEMVALLLAEYEVEEEIAREDCEMIIERWKEMELLEIN